MSVPLHRIARIDFNLTAIADNDDAPAFCQGCQILRQIHIREHFDGKGWENRFALQYGIFSIPTMWLVDKRGNLRDTDIRFDLEEPIKSLLDEQESPTLK